MIAKTEVMMVQVGTSVFDPRKILTPGMAVSTMPSAGQWRSMRAASSVRWRASSASFMALELFGRGVVRTAVSMTGE
jgi:hypothetical protein